MGREDQTPEPDDQSENPPVLTDKICLIPGDEPVVRIEDAPGNARRIFTGVDIRARVEDVWGVLTNYEGLKHVVPNLVENDVIEPLNAGGARLWQVGRSSWRIFGKNFHFQAGMTLDVKLHPKGLCNSGLKAAGTRMCASEISPDASSAEARDIGRQQRMVRDVFPRPFSIPVPGVPIRDITMQSVLGARGDFVHYQGVWRLQPLDSCALPGESMMRLTFAVECEPHWFLPVAPVEGRIASALVENMVAIRDHVEAEFSARQQREVAAGAASSQGGGSSGSESFCSSCRTEEAAEEFLTPPPLALVSEWFSDAMNNANLNLLPWVLPAQGSSRTGASRPSSGGGASSSSLGGDGVRGLGSTRARLRRPRRLPLRSLARLRRRHVGAFVMSAEAMEALARTELRLADFDVSVAAEPSAVGSISELSSALAGVAEAALGFELDSLMAASVATGVAAITLFSRRATDAAATPALAEAQEDDPEDEASVRWAWRAVLEQHPEAVAEREFLGVPFERKDVERRWARFVQTLGISEEQALCIIRMDATPLLVESEDVAEVLGRLAAVSSREKALELVGMNPTLLVGHAADEQRSKGFGVSTIVDIVYAGRLRKVLEEGGRDNAGKVAEIEIYSCVLSSLRPLVEVIQRYLTSQDATAACRRLFRTLQLFIPNPSVKVLLSRVAAAQDPWAYLVDQTRAGLSMASSLAVRPSLTTSILPHSAPIMTHLPSIYTRLSILRPHIPRIVRILDPYLDVVEPHLDRIMERMDRIEPHLPYILLHLDVLAPHCGRLLDYFDELMPYADDKESLWARYRGELDQCYTRAGAETDDLQQIEACVVDQWDQKKSPSDIEREVQDKSYLPRLLPYVDFLVPRLDDLAPHLPLVHRHLPHILPYMDILLPYIPRFVDYPRASRNADVLIAYLGWMLQVPHLPKVLFLPGVPRFVSKLSTILPRWPVRRFLENNLRKDEEREKREVKKKIIKKKMR